MVEESNYLQYAIFVHMLLFFFCFDGTKTKYNGTKKSINQKSILFPAPYQISYGHPHCKKIAFVLSSSLFEKWEMCIQRKFNNITRIFFVLLGGKHNPTGARQPDNPTGTQP